MAMADDAQLRAFLASLEDYQAAIPDELVEHYLMLGGFESHDTRLTRLIAFATQKFISDIASDSLHFCRIRQSSKANSSSGGGGGSSGGKQLVLNSDDLVAALRELGVNVKQREYFADNTAAAAAAANGAPGLITPKDEASS